MRVRTNKIFVDEHNKKKSLSNERKVRRLPVRARTYDKHKWLLTADKALEEFSGMIYRLASNLARNEADAQDIFQDVFERFLKYGTKKEFDSLEHAKHWFVRVTINCHNAFLEKKKKLNEVEQDENSLDTIAVEEERKVYFDLTEAVGELEEKYRLVIHLFYYEGYKIKELADLLNENENTIKTRLSRAKKVLKEKLEGEM